MSKTDLKLDWCSHEAAKYAVEKWHYSHSMPAGRTVKIGVWEDGRFVGAIIFAMGATPNLAKNHALPQTQICELCRVALTNHHQTSVSRIIGIALRMLKRQSPGLRLVVSFADLDMGHIGSIYQAGGWVYSGLSNANGSQGFVVNGRNMHRRSVGSQGWRQSLVWLKTNIDPRAQMIITRGKHKYLMPLDAEMRARITPLAKPYPKRATSIDNDAPVVPDRRGRCNATVALQSSDG